MPSLLLLLITVWMLVGNASASRIILNIVSFGAVGDGVTDDSQAVRTAWDHGCSNSDFSSAYLIIPGGMNYLVHSITLRGPCRPRMNVMLYGEVVAPMDPISWRGMDRSRWLVFENVNGLYISGGGRINGRGSEWWSISCRYNRKKDGCNTIAPTSLSLINCSGVEMNSIEFVDSPQVHTLIYGCSHVDFGFVTIRAPQWSPNTDGTHIHRSTHVSIHDSTIGTGDDCISIGDLTSNIAIRNINCGPGHGISVGSLGKDGSDARVDGVRVSFVTFTGTTNGARIKTYPGGRGIARDIRFEHMIFNGVENPIIIDQNYCAIPDACRHVGVGVQLSDVRFDWGFGTSKTEAGVTLNCSRTSPCRDVSLNFIELMSVDGRPVTMTCTNAYGPSTALRPLSCL